MQERIRQIHDEGFTPEADDAYVFHELALAAACYALPPGRRPYQDPPSMWPWNKKWWKGDPAMGTAKDIENRTRELIKAGALILAELERLHRYKPKKHGGHTRSEDDL